VVRVVYGARHARSTIVVDVDVLVLRGQLNIYVGSDCYHLDAGDSMHFPSMQPHRCVNPTDTTTHAVTTILHDGEWYATPPQRTLNGDDRDAFGTRRSQRGVRTSTAAFSRSSPSWTCARASR